MFVRSLYTKSDSKVRTIEAIKLPQKERDFKKDAAGKK